MATRLRVRALDKDSGYVDLRHLMEREDDPYALAGIRQDAGVYDERGRAAGEPLNVAEVAIVNEFGSLDGRIPSRPWVRSAWDTNVEKYEKRFRREVGKAVDGDQSLIQALDRVILEVEADQVESLIALRDPPNAPSTLARKAPKTNPLVDTGQLAQSHDSAVFLKGGAPAVPWKRGG